MKKLVGSKLLRKSMILLMMIVGVFLIGAGNQADAAYPGCDNICPFYYFHCDLDTRQCVCNCQNEVGDCIYAPECERYGGV